MRLKEDTCSRGYQKIKSHSQSNLTKVVTFAELYVTVVQEPEKIEALFDQLGLKERVNILFNEDQSNKINTL